MVDQPQRSSIMSQSTRIATHESRSVTLLFIGVALVYLLLFLVTLVEGPSITAIGAFAAKLGYFNIYLIFLLSLYSYGSYIQLLSATLTDNCCFEYSNSNISQGVLNPKVFLGLLFSSHAISLRSR